MKSLKMTVVALVVGLASFSTLAATLLTQEDVDKAPGKYEKIGTVTSTSQATDPMDLKDELSKLAAREHGKFSGVAEVYKDKK